MPVTPPSGTVTLLFSDIEGSTRVLRAVGVTRYESALETHRQLLREVFARHGGYEVNTEGDSFFVAFARAVDSVRAAIEGQCAIAAHPWQEGERIRVRMGLHTCEATLAAGDYVGVGVHRAARISGAAHGGQIVLSQATRDLLDEDSGIECLDLGAHALKDFGEPQRLYQVLDPRLPKSFPPLRTVGETTGNLAPLLRPVIGREAIIAAIGDLATRAEVRAITLTGPGGTGKTQLAVHVAAGLGRHFEDGVWFVPLQAVAQTDLLLPAIAQTLGVSQAAGQSLAAWLAPKAVLLVLDNFEQIVAAAGQVAELLAQSPRTKVIVTSREPLRIAGEQVYPVPPLAVPDGKRGSGVDAIAACPAVQLFIERARAADPAFRLTADNAAHVAELCVRLDGLPLAIELAAPRVSLLSPAQMVSRLGNRLKLLTTGARDVPRRQQTLRNTLAWSHELLEPAERMLFARLAIFAGGFTLDSTEAVCDADIDVLGALVDRSMVRHRDDRFDMLETIREFAWEQLQSSADHAAIAERHARHFEALAERVHAGRWHHAKEGLDELDSEHDNLRAALDYLERGDPSRALALAGALGWFWHLRSHFTEGRQRLKRVLDAAPHDAAQRARALAAAGEIAAWAGDLAAARPLIDEAVKLWRAQGASTDIGCALVELGWGCFFAGDDSARAVMEEAFRLVQDCGDALIINRARVGLLQVLVGLGELDTVEPLAREALAVSEATADLRSEHFAHHFLADCPLIRGDCATALPRYRRALALAVELRDRSETAIEIQGVAMALCGSGQPAQGLRLAGAAQAEFDALAIDVSGIVFWSALLERYLTAARRTLGEPAATEAWEEGRRTAFEYAIALAADTIPARVQAAARAA